MIISHKHKYLFVQTPHTGSTSVGRELVKHYDGEEILWKHAMFHHFKRAFPDEAEEYFIFSTIRHPFDEVVSLYFKLKNDQEHYSDPSNWKENGGWLSKRGLHQFQFVHYQKASFEEYLKKFFWLPFVNWTVLAHKQFNYVMRYENLNEDFPKVLEKLGLQLIRPLPRVNPTRKSFDSGWLEHPANLAKANYSFRSFNESMELCLPGPATPTSSGME